MQTENFRGVRDVAIAYGHNAFDMFALRASEGQIRSEWRLFRLHSLQSILKSRQATRDAANCRNGAHARVCDNLPHLRPHQSELR